MGSTLFHIAGLPVTAFALGMTASLALCLVLAHWLGRRARLPRVVLERFLLYALPLSLLLARLLYVLVRLPFFLNRPDGLAFRLWQGGYTLWGAVAGILLAGFLAARQGGIRPALQLDAMAPAALTMLALGRFCEGLAGQGFGEEAPGALQFFPVAVANDWGEWRYAVFMLEGLAALVFLLVVLHTKPLRPGGKTRLALILVCAFQVLFESLREDEFLRWGFVRVGQLIPVFVLLYLLVEALYIKKYANWSLPRHWALVLFFYMAVVLVGLEFALDKTSLDTGLLYGVMLAMVTGLCTLVRRTVVGGKP